MGNRTLIAGSAAVLLVLGYFAYQALSTAPVAPPPPPAAPAGAAGQALPDLEQSDPSLRERIAALGSLPKDWLNVGHIAQRLVAAAHLAARGKLPRESLAFLEPDRRFSVKKSRGAATIATSSYKRYDGVAAAVSSVNADAAATLIKDFSPILSAACEALDAGRCDFRADLIQSSQLLLKTPVPSGPVRVRRNEANWDFVDAELEGLAPTQKVLLRMGPRNEAKVQGKLRELVKALGE
jgi:hypothetical protein